MKCGKSNVAISFLLAFGATLVELSLAAGSVESGLTFPVAAPYLPESCRCKEPFLGWSTKKRRCQQGSRTRCVECPHKPGCGIIKTIIGRGLRAYEGDCVYRSKVSTCYHEPTEAALSYPTDIVIDHSGNIVIADSGNNRVRVLVKEFDKMFILAGSGEVGFSGDGGPGRKAKLRYPERLTVFMSEYFEVDEYFFSDIRNQRIRKLTYDDDQQEWIVNTIVGSGTVGDGCPPLTTTAAPTSSESHRRMGGEAAAVVAAVGSVEPCDPLAARLTEPRGLAMDGLGNLYIADSGVRKVRRVMPHLPDPKKKTDGWVKISIPS